MRTFLILLVILSVPSYGEITDNLRWSLDASARLSLWARYS